MEAGVRRMHFGSTRFHYALTTTIRYHEYDVTTHVTADQYGGFGIATDRFELGGDQLKARS